MPMQLSNNIDWADLNATIEVLRNVTKLNDGEQDEGHSVRRLSYNLHEKDLSHQQDITLEGFDWM